MYLNTGSVRSSDSMSVPLPGASRVGGDPRVLVVDGDAEPAAELARLLAGFGVVAEVVGGARDAEARLAAGGVDLVVMEVDLPGEDGLGFCRRLVQRDGPPILVLSRRCDVLDRIMGLESGADDYLAKTAHPLEILARIKALLRRSHGSARAGAAEPAGWRLHAAERLVQAPDGRGVRLSNTEYRFLAAMFPRPGEMLGRDDIAQAVYGGCAPQPRSIDVLASRVRRKLVGLTGRDMVSCVRGVGYVLEAWPPART